PERVGVFLYALNPSGDWFTYYLNEDDKFIHSPIMVFDEVNKKVLVSGLYSFVSRELAKGTLDFAVDRRNMEEQFHRFIPFERDFVRDIAGEKVAEREEELRDFVIRDMVAKSDGGYLLFGEEFSIAQQSYTYDVNGIAQVSSRSVYNYGKIFVLCSNTLEEQHAWSKVISKGQSSVNDFGYYSSFTLCKKREQIHILFNDKLKGNGGVINYVLHNDDTLEEISLFGNQSAYISIVPGETRQLDANTLLIPTSKDRKFAFVKIAF
ncbi:MAG: hypothetical protein LPK45_01780, partial [Bacteroidota bacterium]|nr:hypothetical protein [Bacteroidota bacterium]MDX5429764.1 hypothetical protein [Bacteroidota bacterium]MDX5468543.1 hypothetical protein [Bacteroidota bacterium]